MCGKMNCGILAAAVLGGAVIAGTAPRTSAAYISDDFQSDTVGSPPASATGNDSDPTHLVQVVDSGSTPADPFGGSGNQSLMLQDKSSTYESSVWWQGASPGLASGDFSIKFHLDPILDPVNDYGSTGFDLFLGSGLNNASSGTEALNFEVNNATIYGNQSLAVTNKTVSQGDNHSLTIHFDLSAGTWSATLDGTPLQVTGGGESFPMWHTVSSIDSVMINGYWSSPNGVQAFFDDVNLSAVPEPMSLSLLGLGGLILIRRRRK